MCLWALEVWNPCFLRPLNAFDTTMTHPSVAGDMVVAVLGINCVSRCLKRALMENSVSAARSTCHAKDRSVHPLETKNIRAYSNKTAPLHFPCRLFISHLSSYSVALFLVLQRVPMFLSCIILGGHFFFFAKKDGAQKAVGVQRVPSWPCSSNQRNPTWTGWLGVAIKVGLDFFWWPKKNCPNETGRCWLFF